MATLESPGEPAPRPSRGRGPILLIDDQRFVGIALARLLQGEPGLELHCCERGSEAEAEADRLRPALILQDLVMPDVDGLTLVRAFRERASTAHTPVIVLSGNDDEATRARALAAGAVDYLVKLPSRDVLLACLDRHLSTQTAPSSAGPVATGDAGGDEVLDAEFLATYREEGADDPDETIRELLDVFFRDAEDLVTALRGVAAAGDDAAVRRLAHAIKGCALAAGARALASVAGTIEDGTLAADAGLARVDVELSRARAAAARVTQGRQACGI
jgi:DNA-binding response OmpR family regulator